MAKPWADVAGSPEFQSLDEAGKQAAQQQYFAQVVAPRVPASDLNAARSQFFSEVSSEPAIDENAKAAPFSLKDLALSAGAGGAGGLKALTDLFGVGNVASTKLADIQQAATEMKTPERLAEMARREAIKERAKGNTWEEIKASLGSFAEAPLQESIEALSSSAPIIAGSILAPEVALPAGLARLGMAGKAIHAARSPATAIGAAMGLGSQKGQDYQTVKDEAIARGIPEPEAERLAQKAAEYSLQNAPRQVASTAAGALEGAVGVENVLGKLGKAAPAVEGASKGIKPPGWSEAIGKNVLEEAAPEFIQAATGQLGSNVALQQAGIPTDITSGVLSSALHDALVGGALGGITSPAKMTELHKSYVQDQLAKERETTAVIDAGIKAEEEKLAKTKEAFKQPDLLGLPAPAKEIAPTIDEPVLQNPLGNITPEELGPEVHGYVQKYRADNGMPELKTYSVEDIKDAMTAVHPEGEQGALDAILTAKSGYSGTEKYTPEDVINAALEKNVASDTVGFKDFLQRTTGSSDLTAMSPPQLFSAFKALKDMPANTTGAQIVLPEGTNAQRFKPEQYKQAVDAVKTKFEEAGGPVPIQDLVKTVQETTGLKTERDAHSILNTAIKNEDLTESKTPVFHVVKPDTGEIVSTHADKQAADAVAAKGGLNIQEATQVSVAPSEKAAPRAVLPEGYDIAETTFNEGEKPAAYTITPEGRTKPLATVMEENDLPAKIERLSALRQKEVEKLATGIKEHEATINKGRSSLEAMEARGETATEAYKKAQTQQARAEKVLGKRIDSFKQRVQDYSAPLTSKPLGTKNVTRTAHTVYKEGQKTGTFPTREAAEESILSDMTDKKLEDLVAEKQTGGFHARAKAELDRRQNKPTEGKKVSEVHEGMKPKEEPQTAETIQKTADLRAMLDKFGLKDVGVKIMKAIEEGADGSYAAKLIQIALDSKHPIRTMRHEAMHALKDLGFFTPQQWTSLEKMARTKWVDQYLANNYVLAEDGSRKSRLQAYKDMGLDQQAILEEAIADAFGDFDASKAPPGMLSALLNKMRNFFDALGNYLSGRGFESYKDVFGKIEKGELKGKPEAKGPSEANAWKATPEDQDKAEKYSIKNGILPYVSEGRLDLPMQIKPKFSLKTADKYGIDPVIGIPLNKDGTVTVYYHTTKEQAVKLNASKTIPSEGRSRIYLTNESNGGKILNKPGSFDQEFDGSTVLLNIDPSLLQMDESYDDGRKDFFVPLAQGDFFNRKMNLASIQKSRKEGIVETFSDADMAQRMETALAEYNHLSSSEQKVRLKQARTLLKREHNIGTLLSENGKLEKTRVGDYGLKEEDKSVASMGLGLASAQQITDKLSSCPQSAICEGLCLGETSGGNFLYGGAASEDTRSGIEKSAFRAGPRMMQYLKTEALVVHPEEFALVLNHEISLFEKWANKETERKKDVDTGKMETSEKEIYQPAIRLNVTSDFRPRMWLPIFEAHPDTKFYDYTKLNGNPVAPNHHLTYSSTGFGQFVDGEKVSHKTNNWNAMRGRMDRGDNVAMAFSSKSALPDFVVDEETGTEYQVWDGDNYDARFLDPKPGEEGNLLDRGMIVGLRNKASTLKEKTATKDTDGFFVDYDPKRDGKTVTVPDQSQFGFKMTSPTERKVIPIAKLSLRAAPDTLAFKRWFGDSKIVNADGTPKVMYHGTGQDITEFEPKQAKAIFLTDKPSFAESFGYTSENFMIQDVLDKMSESERKELTKQAEAVAKKNKTFAGDEIRGLVAEKLKSRANIMPVYVSAQNPFDYENPAHVEEVLKELGKQYDTYGRPRNKFAAADIKRGSWEEIERSTTQKAIKALGFDAFYVQEGGQKNLAVYEPTQIKSATGNYGAYDVNNPDIRYSLREFNKNDLPKDKKPYTLPENTMLFHGAHEERANEIEKSGRVLLSRPTIKTSGGSPDEGGLIFFGDKNIATLFANSEADPMAVQFARERGETRNPGVVFETATDRPYKLMNKKQILSKKEADALNKALDLPDYKRLEKGDSASLAAGRGETNSRVIDRYKTSAGEMASPWPVIFRTLGYDGYYDDFAVALTANNGIRLVGDDGRLVKFSLRNIAEEIKAMPNGAAMYGSIKSVTTTRDEKGFIERMMDAISPESISSIRQKALNRYNQLSVYDQRLAEQMGGAALLADASAESGALLSDLAAGVTAAALGVHNRKGGIPVFRNGVTIVDTSVKGPTEIFSPLAAMGDPEVYQAYQFWAGAKRGSRFLADGREEVFTPAMVNYAKQLCDVNAKGNVSGKYPEFAQVQKEWIQYNDGLVDYMVATGVLSKEKANEFKRHGDYIPFYRQLDGEKTVGPNIFQSIAGVKPPKALKGSEAPLADFLETVVRNTQAAIQAGMKNTAAQRAVDVAVQIKQAVELPAQSSAPDTVTVLRGGKPVSYQTSDHLFIEAVKSLNLPELPFLGILAGPANLLRNLVTKDPGFMLANLMRDSMSAYVISGANMLPVVDTIKNFGRAVGGSDPAYQALLNAGILGGYEFSQNIEASGEALAKDLRNKTGTQSGFEKIGKPFTSLWGALEKGTEASDAATRMAVYKDTLARTGNEAEALARALEVMNFNRKGSSAVVRVLTAAIPFLNARMQGLDVFYRAAFGRMGNQDAAQIKRSFFIRGATLASLSVMYWALTHDDDDYKKQEQETKDNNWLIPSMKIKIPIPFEVGILFKVIPERLAAYAFGNDTGKDLSRSMGRALTSTFGIAPPQVVLPYLEAKTNYSFYTGRPIVGQGLEGVAPEYQVGPGTSPIFQKLGKELGASPMMLEHMFKGYTGSMGMYLVDLMDAIGDVNSNSPKASKRFEQMPVIKRFALDPEARGTVTSYYELKKSIDETVRTYNLLERTGSEELGEYTRENAKLLMSRDFISSMDKSLKEIQDMTVAVRSSPMSGDAKREIQTNLTRAANSMTANIQNVRKAVE